MKQEMNKTHFFCVGNPGNNLGDVAAMYGMVLGLKKIFPDSIIDVSYSGNPNVSGIKSIVNCFFHDEECFSPRGLLKLLLCRWHILQSNAYKAIEDSDVIVFAPGACGLHKYNYSHWIKILLFIFLLKTNNKKLVFHGCSMGPFNGKKILFNFICNKIDLIMLRDKTSKQYLQLAGLDNNRYYVTGDSAMIIPTLNSKNEKEKIVGIIPVDFSKMRVNNVSNETENVTMCIIDAIKVLKEKYGITKYHFISHIFDSDSEIDLIRTISNSVEGIETSIVNHTSPIDAFNEYNQLYLCISARHHGGAFSLKMGKPCVCIGYEHKAKGFFQQYELEKYVLDAKNLTSNMLLNGLCDCIDNYSYVEEKIKEHNKQVEDNAMLNTIYIKKLILGEQL